MDDPVKILKHLFDVAVAAADPLACLPAHLPPQPTGRTIVIGAGKAAASMAKAVEDNWQRPLTGMVITRYAHGLPLKHIKVVEAGHPMPDAAGAKAADKILELLVDLTEDDLVLCLVSGGGSSLLAKPGGTITLDEKKQVTKELLACGANITEMNILRKHLSAIKGGRLALAAAPAKIVTLMISDVPGDDPAIIASGPTIPDTSTSEDALAVLRKYQIRIPDSVESFLMSKESSTPGPDHPAFNNSRAVLISTPQAALQAAAAAANEYGITPVILGDSVEGEAKDVAQVFAALTRQVKEYDQPIPKPCVLLSGGETTVTVRESDGEPGRGGRNCEFLLSLLIALDDMGNIYALACDTDGIDGTEDNAGAIITPTTILKVKKQSLDTRLYLARHDSYTFFESLNDLIKTGPTRTNVNDFRAILII
jgi:glycerate 2-kinase